MKTLPIDSSYKDLNKLISDLGKKYAIADTDLEIFRGEVQLIMIDLQNNTVLSMKEDLLPEINKLYERYGYRK